MKRSVWLIVCVVFLFFLPLTAGASNIRMMGLGDPWLMIPDPDTDWIYNPAWILKAPNQVFGTYIGGFGPGELELTYGTPPALTTADLDGDGSSHVGGTGFIYDVWRGKLGVGVGYLHDRENIGGLYSAGGVPFVFYERDLMEQDVAFEVIYALPVNSAFSLGASFLYDYQRDVDKVHYHLPPSPPFGQITDERYLYEYHRLDVTVGAAWQLDSVLELGLSAGGGAYPGQYRIKETEAVRGFADSGDGDYGGGHAHVLGSLSYHYSDRLTFPIIVQWQWDQQRYDADVTGTLIGPYREDSEESWWEILVGVGANYLIHPDCDFLVGGGLYYSYEDWKDDYEQMDSLNYNIVQGQKSHTFELRGGLEGKIWRELVARGGLYYRYSFYDRDYDRTLIPPSPNDFSVSGNGWAQTLGIGLGLSYTFFEQLRVDLGADIPFIAEDHSDLDGFLSNGNPYIREIDEGAILYRLGINLTWLFL
jgi:hypothetical protein